MDELLELVKRYAPQLAAFLLGPFASSALSALFGIFGVSSDGSGDVSELLTKMKSDPEQEFKLKKLEYDHLEAMSRIYGDDKKDARLHGVQYSDFLRHMAYLITTGFFGALIILFIPVQISSNQRELLSLLVGMLVSKWNTIIDFFYGSSHQETKRL